MRFLGNVDKNAERGDSGAAIRLGDSGREIDKGNRWGLVLVLFMRMLALIWVFQGLTQWAAVLVPRQALFDNATPMWGAAVIFFAILDLVAAVGLWLATPWGGVIWLFGAIAQIFVALAIRSFFNMAWIGVNCILILAYFVLTWQAAQSGAPFKILKRLR
jgi:hypothetical protein